MHKTQKIRLESLDILRGFDLFLLVAVHPILVGIAALWSNPSMDAVMHQFDHESWAGFRLWDIIMPLFLFITGTAIPFSLDNQKINPSASLYVNIVRRFIILWILGMIIQGNLLGFELQYIKLYSNTLQAIAVGYLVTSILYLHLPIKSLYAAVVGLLIIYSVPFLMDNDFSEQHNFAMRVDKQVLVYFMDGAYWDESGNWNFSPSYNYTWIWSSLTFVVSVMTGCLAGKYIKDNKDKYTTRIALVLAIAGLALLIIGLGLGAFIPIIKRIWSSSMVLFSTGINLLLLALFFYIIDVKKWGGALQFLKVFGMNSIVAYFLGEFINFRPIIHQFTYGLENHFPEAKILLLNTGNVLLIFWILWLLYRNQKFIKI